MLKVSKKCPNAGICGSCKLSNMPYLRQLEFKKDEVNKYFAKLFGADKYYLKNIIPSKRVTHYRNKMDFTIDFKKNVGLRQSGYWNKVIDNHPCFISDTKIEELFYIVRNWVKSTPLLGYDRVKHTGFLRYAVIRSTSTGDKLVNIVSSTFTKDTPKEFALSELQKLGANPKIKNLVLSINPTITDLSYGNKIYTIKGRKFIMERILSFPYRISVNSFFQSNLYMSPTLLSLVLKNIKSLNSKKVLDLYSGLGFFTIPTSFKVKKAVGVELSESSFRDAFYNIKINNAKNIKFLNISTEDYEFNKDDFDTVIVDPPRAGIDKKTLSNILKSGTSNLIYVSCNYKTFALNLLELEKEYTLKSLVGIDMFPQTPHLELLAVFTKSSKKFR